MRKKIVMFLMCMLMILMNISASADDDDVNGWIVKNYVDEFGLETENQYITNERYIYGTFSNSATDDSELKAQFLIDSEKVTLRLYEYGDNQVKNIYSDKKFYSLSVLDSQGEKHSISCSFHAKGDRLYIGNIEEFCRILEYGGETSFYIKEDDGLSEYKFTVDFDDDFTDVYNQIGGEFQSNEEYQAYLEEENEKYIDYQLSLYQKDDLSLECSITGEIPDGTIISLRFF